MMFITTNIKYRRKIFEVPAYANEAVETLYQVQHVYPFFLYGFVIMPDHAHLLTKIVSPGNISTVIHSFKRNVSLNIGIGPIWQPRFHMRIPDDPAAALRYIHQNPVKAFLVEKPEDYAWSSASGRWDVAELGRF